MPETLPAPEPLTGSQFEAALIEFVAAQVQAAHKLPVAPDVSAATPLFESGLVDSLGILQLIAFVEKTTGQSIPTRMVVMKHFRTIEAICQKFWRDQR